MREAFRDVWASGVRECETRFHFESVLIGPGEKGDKPGANALKRTGSEETPGNPRFEKAERVIQQLLAHNARRPAALPSPASLGRK